MSERLKGLWRLAAVSAPALALVACDSGYKAGYYEGFSLGYETKGSEKTEKQQAAAAPDDAVPLVLATPAPVQVAEIAPPKTQAARPVRVAQRTSAGQAKPAARPAAQSASAAAAAEPAAVETAAVERPPAQPSPGAKPQPAIAPFAPLRPGPSGGGVIIRVGNNTATPSDDDKPDDGVKPGDGSSGDGGGKAPPPPVVSPQLPGTQVAKITIVDTNLIGVTGNNQLIGVGIGSSSPTQAQLASVNVLPADGRSLASVDSLASISIGNTPIVSGGTTPLVSVNALPDLSGVTQIVSPVTGALVGSGGTTATASSGGGASTSTAAIPVVPVVTNVVANVGATATNLVGGLLGGGSSSGKH